MDAVVRISEAAEQLKVTPYYLRILEREGRIPPPRRDYNGRIYTSLDLAMLRAMGVGSRPRRLKKPEEVLGG